MKRNELLNTMRPSNARKAVEMALRPRGVTSYEMVETLGAPMINRLRAFHVQGLATLLMARDGDQVAYYLVTDERLTAQGLRAQQQRREAHQRMIAEPVTEYADDDDCND